MTSHDASLLDKMTESAGELLFEASAHEVPFARDVLKKLAHHLGRLYGETIRASRDHDGLREEVQTTFMSGMAIEPNFGREEVLRDSGAEAQEEKTAGQLLFEKECGPTARPWAELPLSCRIAHENKAKENAAAMDAMDEVLGEAVNGVVTTLAKSCWKCKGTKDMGFTTHVPCDAC